MGVRVWGEKRIEGGGSLERAWYCVQVERYLARLVVDGVERVLGLPLDGVEEMGELVNIRWYSVDGGVSPEVIGGIKQVAEAAEGEVRRFLLLREAAREWDQRGGGA